MPTLLFLFSLSTKVPLTFDPQSGGSLAMGLWRESYEGSLRACESSAALIGRLYLDGVNRETWFALITPQEHCRKKKLGIQTTFCRQIVKEFYEGRPKNKSDYF